MDIRIEDNGCTDGQAVLIGTVMDQTARRFLSTVPLY